MQQLVALCRKRYCLEAHLQAINFVFIRVIFAYILSCIGKMPEKRGMEIVNE